VCISREPHARLLRGHNCSAISQRTAAADTLLGLDWHPRTYVSRGDQVRRFGPVRHARSKGNGIDETGRIAASVAATTA